MEGETLGENRHVFGNDVLANRFREFGLTLGQGHATELIGTIE